MSIPHPLLSFNSVLHVFFALVCMWYMFIYMETHINMSPDMSLREKNILQTLLLMLSNSDTQILQQLKKDLCRGGNLLKWNFLP